MAHRSETLAGVRSGAVTVIRHARRAAAAGNRLRTQSTTGVEGAAASGDRSGWSLLVRQCPGGAPRAAATEADQADAEAESTRRRSVVLGSCRGRPSMVEHTVRPLPRQAPGD